MRSRSGPLLFLKATWSTITLARLALKGMKGTSGDAAHVAFDTMAQRWGERMLELGALALSVSGEAHLQGLRGKLILVFNHLSALDFMLSFFALRRIRLASGRGIRIRFVVARDHFKDNRLIYDWLGVGKAIARAGMIFIERKQKGKGFDNLRQAARDFLATDVDIAIYPQGTRARSRRDLHGEWRDGGYYTTFSKKTALLPLGHLKKGVAFFAKAVGEAMQASDDAIHLVPIGIIGTGAALPTGRLVVNRGRTVEFRIGKPLSYTASELTALSEDALLGAVNEALLEVLDYQRRLRERFLQRVSSDARGAIERAMLALIPEQQDIVYPLIDRLYALPPIRWPDYETQIEQQLLNRVSSEWLSLLERISL